jgi:hypothetical protein
MEIINGDKKKPVLDNRPWPEKVNECAQQFSQVLEERWVGSTERARQFLMPKKVTDQELSDCIGIFIDYLLGTTVALVCNGRAAPPEFEEDIIAIIREKFAWMRKNRGA